MSSNIKCPPKRGRNRREKKSHGSRAIIGFEKNQDRHGDSMGRTQLTLERHCKRSHFTWGERLALQYYYAGTNGYQKVRSPTMLGKLFQKSAKTITRELRRGMVEHVLSDIPFVRIEYNAEHAQLDAEAKMGYKGPQPKSGKHYALVQRIATLIREDHYSPYAVLKKLDEEASWPSGLRICEKTLYNWVKQGDIPGVSGKELPRAGRMKRAKGHRKHRKHATVAFAVRSIEKRPKDIVARQEAGHWEGDTVYSGHKETRECLLTLVERKTRLEVILKLPNRTAVAVRQAFDQLEWQLGSQLFRTMFRSITLDNGVEFSLVKELEHSVFTNDTRTTLYFAHPYCSSERGTSENHNGIIRRFLPKGTNFNRVSDTRIREIQDWINTYPRKILGGFTPLHFTADLATTKLRT